MCRVLADGEERHRVEGADGTVIGWIHDRAIGFRGFDDEAQATVAAAVAWRALDRVLRREFAGWPRHEPAYDRLRVVQRGTEAWISDGEWPLAQLLRLDDAPGGPRLALEFRLPSYAREGIAVAAAHLMGVALGDMLRAAGPARVDRIAARHDAPAA